MFWWELYLSFWKFEIGGHWPPWGHFWTFLPYNFKFWHHLWKCSASLNFPSHNVLSNTEDFSIWPPGGNIVTSITSERSKFQSVNFCFMSVQKNMVFLGQWFQKWYYFWTMTSRRPHIGLQMTSDRSNFKVSILLYGCLDIGFVGLGFQKWYNFWTLTSRMPHIGLQMTSERSKLIYVIFWFMVV